MNITVGTRTESLYEVLFPIGFWPGALLMVCFGLAFLFGYWLFGHDS